MQQARPDHDVAVIGGGPAGAVAAAEIAETGLRTVAIAPHEDRWAGTYGVWADEAAAHLDPGDLEAWWPQALVRPAGQVRVLSRGYARIDGDVLRGRLRKRAADAGAQHREALVRAADHRREGTVLALQDGSEVAARVVVDASGHRPVLVQRGPHPEPPVQAAYGLRTVWSRPPAAPGSAMIMDFSTDHLTEPERHEAATFCYALDFGDGTWLVEETSLSRRPPLDQATLADRLHRRLERAGAEPLEPPEVERVHIPMGLPVPDTRQRAVGFGGAASLVHPATGYQLGHALRRAPRLAGALARLLRDPRTEPAVAARAGWNAVWPPTALRRRALEEFGLSALLRLDAAQTRAFFAAFFALPDRTWQGYLDSTLPPVPLAAAMMRLFVVAPGSVRAELLRTLLGPDAAMLARGIVGGPRR